MKKIMFISSGNICRGVIAQYLFKDIIKKKGKEGKYYICSSGVFAFEGQSVIDKTINIMNKKFNIDVSEHKAVSTDKSEIYNMDLVLCMTGAQKLQLKNRYKEIAPRITTLKEYVIFDNDNNKDIDIEETYNKTEEAFENCVNEIEQCLNKLINILE